MKIRRKGREICENCGGRLMIDVRALVTGVVAPLNINRKCALCGN